MKFSSVLKPPLLRRLVFLSAVVAASVVFTHFYALHTMAYGPGSYERLANFTANKVFQTRILAALLVKAVVPALSLLRHTFQPIIPYPVDADLVLKAWCTIFVAAIICGFGSLMRALGNANLPRGAEILILIPVYWNYAVLNGAYYPYDMASLAFYCWAIVLYLRRKFGWFYVVYVLGVVNRESICFATMSILAIELRWHRQGTGRSSWRQAWAENSNLIYHCAAQSVVWFVIISAIQHIFRNNPGMFHEHPESMLDFIRRIWSKEPHWAMRNPRMFLTLFLGFWVMIPLCWGYIPRPTRRLLWLVPSYLLIAYRYANMMETRIYGELNIVIAATALAGVNGWIRAHFPAAPRPLLRPAVRWAGAAVIVTILAFAADRYIKICREKEIGWTYTLRRNPQSWTAGNNPSSEPAGSPGRLPEALAYYEQELRMKPDDAEANNNLANALAGIPGRLPEALAYYEEALRIKPDLAEAHNNLANALAGIPGRLPEAVAHYEEALRIKPDLAEAHYNLANALAEIPGRLPEALAQYEEALRIMPDDAEAQNNVAAIYVKTGRFDEAIAHLELALKLDPALTEARENLKKLRAMRR